VVQQKGVPLPPLLLLPQKRSGREASGRWIVVGGHKRS